MPHKKNSIYDEVAAIISFSFSVSATAF